MKKIKIYAEVPDDFEKGCCYDCPFSQTEHHLIDEGDGYYETDDITRCILWYDSSDCPIEFEGESNNE